MTDQLQTAKDWLGDLSKIVSQQKTKEDYEYAKKRTDALGYLINRVEELENNLEKEVTMSFVLEGQLNDASELVERYKQALEFYADKKNYETDVVSQWEPVRPAMEDGGYKARKALKGESQ